MMNMMRDEQALPLPPFLIAIIINGLNAHLCGYDEFVTSIRPKVLMHRTNPSGTGYMGFDKSDIRIMSKV